MLRTRRQRLGGGDPRGVLAPSAVEVEPVGPDRVQVRPACGHRDLVPCAIQQGGQRSADRPRSDHADAHAPEPRCQRRTPSGSAWRRDARRVAGSDAATAAVDGPGRAGTSRPAGTGRDDRRRPRRRADRDRGIAAFTYPVGVSWPPTPVNTAISTAIPSATPISRSVEFMPLAFAVSSSRMCASTAVETGAKTSPMPSRRDECGEHGRVVRHLVTSPRRARTIRSTGERAPRRSGRAFQPGGPGCRRSAPRSSAPGSRGSSAPPPRAGCGPERSGGTGSG